VAVLCIAACGRGPIGPQVDTTTPRSLAGTWKGIEQYDNLQSSPASHCLVEYLRRNQSNGFITSVTLTLAQQGTSLSGTYSGADAGAFSPFSCSVTGSINGADLILDLGACTVQNWGVQTQCQGTMRRSGGRLTGSGGLEGRWQQSVQSWDRSGNPLDVIDWRSTLLIR
jgi:hypothetical protein